MKPISFPKLTLPDSGSRVAPTLGHPLVDDYLESVHARLRPNSTLAVVYDLKVFFTVIDVDPLEVRRRHVLEFIRVQRTGSADATVIPIDQSEGLALSTIRRRLSILAGFYSHLVALGHMDHNPVQRGMPVRAPVTRDRRVVPLVRPVRHLPRILDHDDVIKLVSALRKDRDRAMIDAMLLAGLRRCEVLSRELSVGVLRCCWYRQRWEALMGQRGRPTARIVLSDDEREALERWARRRKTQQALALRCRIVLAAATGATNQQIAKQLGCNPVTVGKWRTRFAAKRLDGLLDEPRPGQPRKIPDEIVEQVIGATLETTPDDGSTQWSTRSMAAKVGLNQTAVSRIWRTFGLKPHRIDDFKLSTDPQFIDKVRDVVGLYLNPPDAAVVLCVDEKTQVQALDRTAPVLPMLPGTPARRSYTYVRNGTSDLYAALDVASGKVITQMTDQHRAVEFRAFLNLIDKSVPDDLAVHVICDNASTHKAPEIVRWLKRHRRFTLHYTPTFSSWLNQVERWFSELTTKKLRRSTHRSVAELRRDIEDWVEHWNANPRPFIWRKTADEILDNLAGYLQRINDSRH